MADSYVTDDENERKERKGRKVARAPWGPERKRGVIHRTRSEKLVRSRKQRRQPRCEGLREPGHKNGIMAEALPSYTDEYLIISEEMRDCIINKENDKGKSILPSENLDAYIDSFGLPLLHLAVANANPEMTQYLIEKGCNINAVYDERFTPLMVAILTPCVETVEILVDAHCTRDIKGSYLNNIVEFCTNDNPCTADQQLTLEICLKRIKAHFGNNADDMFEALLQANCQLYTIIKLMKDAEATKYFLDRGCDIDQRDPATNFTPLQLAIQIQHFDNVKLLLEYGASTRFMNDKYKYDFVMSLKSYENNSETRLAIFEIFLQYNINFFDQVLSIFGNVSDLYARGRVVTKLIVAQLVLDDACGREISDRVRLWTGNQIDSSKTMRQFYTLCELQITKMKQTVFYESATLFEVLVESREKLLLYVKNDNFMSKFADAINTTLDTDSYYYRALKNRVPGASAIVQSKLDVVSANLLDLDMKET